MRPTAAVLCLAVLAPLAAACSGGDDEDDGSSTVELRYDRTGLTVVIDVGDGVDLRTARELNAFVTVGDTDDGADYTIDLSGSRSKPTVIDGEANPLLCGQRATVTARTLTFVFPTRCTSKSDPSPRQPLLPDPMYVWTTLEASFRGSTDPVAIDVDAQRIERS
ncbi:hypothetical protein GCM10023340_26270 [Nocardioides marinquilinus]|uniref:Lipoprotein n=1 Tax=Nocardioides marinquilinus TaxID=1210400 RepID=A0ABP9PPQ5_9ACTN